MTIDTDTIRREAEEGLELSQKRLCPPCAGTGKVNPTRVLGKDTDCWQCGGTGKRVHSDLVPSQAELLKRCADEIDRLQRYEQLVVMHCAIGRQGITQRDMTDALEVVFDEDYDEHGNRR